MDNIKNEIHKILIGDKKFKPEIGLDYELNKTGYEDYLIGVVDHLLNEYKDVSETNIYDRSTDFKNDYELLNQEICMYKEVVRYLLNKVCEQRGETNER